MIYFNIEKYKFACGNSDVYDRWGIKIRQTQNYVLWMWNGYYWGIEFQHLSGEEEARKIAAARVEQNKLDFPENHLAG